MPHRHTIFWIFKGVDVYVCCPLQKLEKMDLDLKWHTQVNDVTVRLRKANGVLSKLRHYMPESTFKSVYYAFFCQIWGQHVQNVSTTLNFELIVSVYRDSYNYL